MLEATPTETDFEVDSRHWVQLGGAARVVLPMIVPILVLSCWIGWVLPGLEGGSIPFLFLTVGLVPSMILLAPLVLGGSRMGWTRLVSVSMSSSGITSIRESYLFRKKYLSTIAYESIIGIKKSARGNSVVVDIKGSAVPCTRSVPILFSGVQDPEGFVKLGLEWKMKKEREKYPSLESLLGQEEAFPPNWKRKD